MRWPNTPSRNSIVRITVPKNRHVTVPKNRRRTLPIPDRSGLALVLDDTSPPRAKGQGCHAMSAGSKTEHKLCLLWVISGHYRERIRDVRFTPHSGHEPGPLKESAKCQNRTFQSSDQPVAYRATATLGREFRSGLFGLQLRLDGDGDRLHLRGQRDLLEHRLGDLMFAHNDHARAMLF